MDDIVIELVIVGFDIIDLVIIVVKVVESVLLELGLVG